MIILLTCAAGGLGAVMRYLVDRAVVKRLPATPLPLGLFVVNISACFLMGVAYGAWGSTSNGIFDICARGLLGGYSTFGSAIFEAVTLWRSHKISSTVFHLVGMVGLCWLALGLGMLLVR